MCRSQRGEKGCNTRNVSESPNPRSAVLTQWSKDDFNIGLEESILADTDVRGVKRDYFFYGGWNGLPV